MIAAAPHEFARELLEKYGNEIPVDVYRVAAGEGVLVEEVDLEPSVSGFLVVKGTEDVVIGVNKDHHPYRKRFTVAHELGHFLFHGAESASNVMTGEGKFVYFRDEASETGEVEHERKANQFAADLLMPKEALKGMVPSKIRMSDETAIRRLALKFDVSFTAMSIRLTTLKMLQ